MSEEKQYTKIKTDSPEEGISIYDEENDTLYVLSGTIRVIGFDKTFDFHLVSLGEDENFGILNDWLEGVANLSVFINYTQTWKDGYAATFYGNRIFSKQLGQQAIVEISRSDKMVVQPKPD